MKLKLALTLAATSLASVVGVSTAMAGYGMAGCGLGSVVISTDGFMQVLAATTNGTFASQTFGITTGTSNCTKAGVVLASKEQEAFFEANYASLQRDIASGGGEHLAALTDLMGCEGVKAEDVGTFAQEQYSTVFPASDTTSNQALYTFKLKLSLDQRFADACAKL